MYFSCYSFVKKICIISRPCHKLTNNTFFCLFGISLLKCFLLVEGKSGWSWRRSIWHSRGSAWPIWRRIFLIFKKCHLTIYTLLRMVGKPVSNWQIHQLFGGNGFVSKLNCSTIMLSYLANKTKRKLNITLVYLHRGWL